MKDELKTLLTVRLQAASSAFFGNHLRNDPILHLPLFGSNLNSEGTTGLQELFSY